MNDMPVNNPDNALVVGHGRFDAYEKEPGANIAKSGSQQLARCLTVERDTNIPLNEDIVKAVAMDIGKELVDYVELMYPDAIKAASSTFRLSLRNHVYNDIMCMVKITDEERLKEWLDYRAKFRRYMKRMKKARSTEEADRIWKQAPVNPAMKW